MLLPRRGRLGRRRTPRGRRVLRSCPGYLVTSLLLGEHARTGTVKLRQFWARRARRLLPALFVLLAGVCVYARWADTGISPGQIRGDAFSTLAYVANWHYIFAGQNYFTQYAAPSPLIHTWSLAVEEQFYLVWPLVVLLVLRRFGRLGVGLDRRSPGGGLSRVVRGAVPQRRVREPPVLRHGHPSSGDHDRGRHRRPGPDDGESARVRRIHPRRIELDAWCRRRRGFHGAGVLPPHGSRNRTVPLRRRIPSGRARDGGGGRGDGPPATAIC